MGSLELESSRLTKMKSLADELNSGQASAARLQVLMKENLSTDNCSAAAAELLAEVMTSFSKSLSLVAMEIIAETLLAHAKPPSSGEQKNESPSWKRKRSCCRRRENPNSCRTVVSRGIEDGYTWRKYGQKIIGASHQRSYFRCKHKLERGCQAIRQVQRTPEDASMFEITYMGEHTCELEVNERTPPCVISLEQGTDADGGQETPLSSTDPGIKCERDEQVLIDLPRRGGASSELMAFHGLSGFQAPAAVPYFEGVASDQYDVTSEFWPSAMEIEAETFDLSDIFEFDCDELFG